MAKYTFTLPRYASDSLTQEVEAAALGATLLGITSLENEGTLEFDGDLTSEAQAVLAAVVAAHKGIPLPPPARSVVLDSPKTDDGKPVFDIYPGTAGFYTWITGHGDDPNPTPPATGRGTGTPLILEFTAEEIPATKSLEFQFNDPVEIHDGQIVWRDPANWSHLDSFSVGFKVPASVAVPNATGTGNCNKMPVGPGINAIIPANGDGAYDISPEGRHPVEDRQKQGAFWDNDYATGAVTPHPVPGRGKYNLFDVDLSGWLVRNIHTTHPKGVFDIDVYKVEYFHPSWRLFWEARKETPGAGVLGAWIFCFRRITT